MKHQSVGELGTTRASMNRTCKTNAAKGVDKAYNEYKEFHDREIEAHICATFMEMTNMSSLKGIFVIDPLCTIMKMSVVLVCC